MKTGYHFSMRALAALSGAFVATACIAQVGSMMDPAKAVTMPLALLQQVAVQKDLQLTGAQKTAIKKASDDLNKETRAPGASFTQLSNTMNDANRKCLEPLDEKQRTRFQEIRYQVLGIRSLGEAEVQAALALTEEQLAAFKAFEKEEMSGMLREAQKGSKALGNWQKGKAKREAEVAKILTPEQAEKLQALYGKPFKEADKIAGR